MKDIAILFAGDFCPIRRAEQLALDGKPNVIFGDLLMELHKKDLSVVNLECPLTKTNSPICKTGPHLRAHPKVVECLKAGRFDIANLANNHVANYGASGLSETIHVLQSNKIEYVGAGSSLSIAEKPLQVNCKGSVVTFLAFAENEFNTADEKDAGAWPLDPVVNISQIRRAKSGSDIVIALVHGGDEHSPVPSVGTVKTCRAFVEAGASAVIGAHPHVPQGYEVYNRAPIFYSLGNLVFDLPQMDHPLWSRSYMVRLRFHDTAFEGIDIIPYEASARTGCVSLLKAEELDEFIAYLRFLSRILEDECETEWYWRGWCAMMGPKRLRWLSLASPIGYLYTALPCKRSLGLMQMLTTRNLVTCEAHNEVLSTYLDLVRKEQLHAAREYIPAIRILQRGKVPDS